MSLTKLNGVCNICRIIKQNFLHFDGVRVSWERDSGPRVAHYCCSGGRGAANNFVNYRLEYNFNIITPYLYTDDLHCDSSGATSILNPPTGN
jgi:hypothetical protein